MSCINIKKSTLCSVFITSICMQFIASRKKFYTISGIFFLISFFVFFFLPKNLGIDMTGWLQIEYNTSSSINEEKLSQVKENIINSYNFSGEKIVSDLLVYSLNENTIRVDVGLSSEPDVTKDSQRSTDIRQKFPNFFHTADIVVSESSFVVVGKSFGKFVLDRAYLTLTVCLFGIALYLMFAFKKSIAWTSGITFGVITLATLLHDIIIAPGIYIILGLFFPELKIDTFFVTAILTILGYSINDTIVILDRIRSNYRDKRAHDKRTDKQIFEESIQVSLRRSIYTSMTLVIVLISMLLFWPDALFGFVTLMLLGTIIGTYSSICIAAPVLYDINFRNKS